MSHAGDERAECGELLALAKRRLHRSKAADRRPDDGERHIRPGVQQLTHRVDRDAQGLAIGHRADGREATASLERRDLSLQRARADARQRNLGPPGPLGDLELAIEDDEERIGLLSLADEPIAWRQVNDLAALDQPRQPIVVEALEERREAQAFRDVLCRQVLVRHSSAMYSWTS